MGFTNNELNSKTLKATHGNLYDAIEILELSLKATKRNSNMSFRSDGLESRDLPNENIQNTLSELIFDEIQTEKGNETLNFDNELKRHDIIRDSKQNATEFEESPW